jgi:hypothetical protein
MPKARIETPPKRWGSRLYSFTEHMPLEGWVWEFMRRARLKQLPGNAPVNAMNPTEFDFTKDEEIDYWYLTWPQAIAKFSWWKNGTLPYYLAPAVRLQTPWPIGFEGQPMQLPPMKTRGIWVDIAIDLNRRDTVIRRDLEALLKQIRIQQKIPQPKQIKPHVGNWSKPLMVWDLYQYGIPGLTIADLLDIHPSEGARVGPEWRTSQVKNYYEEATPYIDEGKWEDLARFI